MQKSTIVEQAMSFQKHKATGRGGKSVSTTEEDQKPAAVDKKRSQWSIEPNNLVNPRRARLRANVSGTNEEQFQDPSTTIYSNKDAVNVVTMARDLLTTNPSLLLTNTPPHTFATARAASALSGFTKDEDNKEELVRIVGLDSSGTQTNDLAPAPFPPVQLDPINQALVDLFCHNTVAEPSNNNESVKTGNAMANQFLVAQRCVEQMQTTLELVLQQFGLKAESSSSTIPLPKLLLPSASMIFRVKNLLETQELFRLAAKPTLVDIAYHYSQSVYMDSIRTTGLLSKAERDEAGIKSKCNGAVLGDGIYTCDDPLTFKSSRYGQIGLMVMRLKGVETVSHRRPRRGICFGNSLSSEANKEGDTVVCSGGSRRGQAVLKQSAQCVCLLEFPASMLGFQVYGATPTSIGPPKGVHSTFSGTMINGTEVIQVLHVELQKCVDRFFNNGIVTSVPEFRTVPQPRLTMLPPPVAPVHATRYSSGVAQFQTKEQQQRFLIFSKVLVKYLEQKDPSLCIRVKAIMRECAERNKRGEPGYESVTASMRKRLREAVSDQYWMKTENHLSFFLAQRNQGGSNIAPTPQQSGGGNSSFQTPTASAYPSSAQTGLYQNANGQGSVPSNVRGQLVNNVHALPQSPALFNQSTQSVDFVIRYEAPESLHDPADLDELISFCSLHSLSDGDGCPICLRSFKKANIGVTKLKTCGHMFCHSCIITSLEHSRACPVCREVTNKPQGKMPSGYMRVCVTKQACDGCPWSIRIDYYMEGGIQKAYHVNPGARFYPAHRTAYLPNDEQGRALLKRLKFAFQCGLTFTVGESLTTARQNVITWSSIHHKTSLSRGVHGFPDPNFFQNANKELDALGVPKSEYLS